MSSWNVRGAVPIFMSQPVSKKVRTKRPASIAACLRRADPGAPGRRLQPLLLELPQLVHPADSHAVPDVAQMHTLTKVLDEPRSEDSQAFAAGMPHAVIDDSVRAAELQLPAEYLRRDVAVGIVDVGHAGTLAADVMKSRRDVGQV